MKGNIITELRKFVNTLYKEGHSEIFAFSIVVQDDDINIQTADFSLDSVDLPKTFTETYAQARRTMMLVRSRYGEVCTAINSLICDEVTEEVWLDENVLRVLNLNI